LGVRPRDPAPTSHDLTVASIALHFGDQIRSTTRLRGPSYEGLYKSTRPYSGLPGRFIHDHCLVRMGDNGLLSLKMATGGVKVQGWVLPLNNQLYVIGSEFTSGAMVFALLNGVNSRTVEVLDGLILSPSLDALRTPTAGSIVLRRLQGLSADPAAAAPLQKTQARATTRLSKFFASSFRTFFEHRRQQIVTHALQARHGLLYRFLILAPKHMQQVRQPA